MYPKHKIESLIKKFSPIFIKKLGLTRWKIEFYVVNSNSKVCKQYALPYHKKAAGLSLFNRRTAMIFIFYNDTYGKVDAIGTILHELLHLVWDGIKNEETIIRRIESTVEVLLKSYLRKSR